MTRVIVVGYFVQICRDSFAFRRSAPQAFIIVREAQTSEDSLYLPPGSCGAAEITSRKETDLAVASRLDFASNRDNMPD